MGAIAIARSTTRPTRVITSSPRAWALSEHGTNVASHRIAPEAHVRNGRLESLHGSSRPAFRSQPWRAHRHPCHRAGRRAGGILWTDARGARRRRHQGRAVRRNSDTANRSLLRGPRRSRALAVLLAVQPREALDRARSASGARPRAV